MRNIFIIGLLLTLVLGLSACTPNESPPDKYTTTQTENNMQANIVALENLTASQELKQFASVDELKTFLSSQSSSGQSNDMLFKGAATGGVRTAMAESSVAAPMANGAYDSASADYSSTNVQVEGVDEGDFVKNDDKYIYMISDNNLVIIDARDGKDSEIVSKTKLESENNYYYGVKELFLNKDKVIVFRDSYEDSFYLEKYDITPIQTQKQNTIAYIYDVSDRSKPKLLEQFKVSGTYYSSRMIGDIVYMVTQEGLYDWRYYDGPMVSYAKTVIRPEIYYFDNPEQNYQMNTVTSIDIDDESVVDSKSLMLGYSNTLMVSENNIYIAYQKQNYWCWGWRCTAQDDNNREKFMTVVVPLLEGDIKDSVDNIIAEHLDEDEEWSKISLEFNRFYSELKDDKEMQDTYEDMFVDIEDALNEYESKNALEQSKTIIHKLSIKDGKIDYESKGTVDGRLLNQFSLDEFDGNLRVATTVDLWLNRGGRVQYNNVYVLDDDMKVVGSLEDLARNETIYSTRFMGDKLYMVTFRQVDPFFVIDLSDSKNPEVLGYLKIPGYSSYLHPVSDNLIIGVGKETGENEYGGVTTKGVKISLFDVSDFENPKEVDKYEIGLQGTDSPILYDHRAFLYSPTKDILVIPVTEIVDRTTSGKYMYRTKIWNGAYVFDVSDDGFELKGKVEHSSSETDYYSWFNSASVMRSLYIDNTLYTISNKYVKASDLDDDLKELNSISLPYNEEPQYDYPMPLTAIAE